MSLSGFEKVKPRRTSMASCVSWTGGVRDSSMIRPLSSSTPAEVVELQHDLKHRAMLYSLAVYSRTSWKLIDQLHLSLCLKSASRLRIPSHLGLGIRDESTSSPETLDWYSKLVEIPRS